MINKLKAINRGLLELDLGILFCGMVCQLAGMWTAIHKGMYAAALWLGIVLALLEPGICTGLWTGRWIWETVPPGLW